MEPESPVCGRQALLLLPGSQTLPVSHLTAASFPMRPPAASLLCSMGVCFVWTPPMSETFVRVLYHISVPEYTRQFHKASHFPASFVMKSHNSSAVSTRAPSVTTRSASRSLAGAIHTEPFSRSSRIPCFIRWASGYCRAIAPMTALRFVRRGTTRRCT